MFENRLISLKSFWTILGEKEFIVGGKVRKMDMMPFDIVEGDLRNKRPVPLVQLFGGSGLRASFDRTEGIKIWFTNSLAEHQEYQQVKEEIESIWQEVRNNV